MPPEVAPAPAEPTPEVKPIPEPSPADKSPEKPADGKERGADGKFAPKLEEAPDAAPDWRAGIEDPDLKELAKRIASPADAVKSIADLRKANGSMVKLPGKDAKPEDVAKYRKALGIPDKPEDYKFDVEGHEATDADMAIRTAVATVLHKHNVPGVAAPELSKLMADIGANLEAERDRVAIEHRDDLIAILRKEWGADFEPNKNLSNHAAAHFGGQEFSDFINDNHINGQKLGDHPTFLRTFGLIGRRMIEGNPMGTVGPEQKATLTDELEKLYTDNPIGTDKYSSAPVQKRMREIQEALHGTAPIVGEGRAV